MVADFAHEVKACALGQASSSIMARHVVGSTAEELRNVRAAMRRMLKEGAEPPAGKWADLVVLRGNPLQDIKHVRNPRVVIKAGRVYDPTALLKSAEGKIGPASAADTAVWAPTPRTRRGGPPGQ